MKAHWVGVLGLLLFATPARADKLIWIPTADVTGVHGEFMSGSDTDGEVYTAQFGLGRAFELMGRRYRTQHTERTEVGGQVQVLPEGFATPGVALGVWDVNDETPRGRRVFGVLSKKVPGVHFLPTVLRELRLHLGTGSGDLSGIFLGAQASLPLGFSLALEQTRGGFNAGLWWAPVRIVRLKAETWDGDLFFGAQLNTLF